MNRRSFIGKALAGIAAVPLLGKLAHAAESAYFKPVPTKYGRVALANGLYFPFKDPPPLLPAFRTVTITFNREALAFAFIADDILHERKRYFLRLKDGHGDHALRVVEYALIGLDEIKVTAAIEECHDAMSCRLGCFPPTLHLPQRSNLISSTPFLVSSQNHEIPK